MGLLPTTSWSGNTFHLWTEAGSFWQCPFPAGRSSSGSQSQEGRGDPLQVTRLTPEGQGPTQVCLAAPKPILVLFVPLPSGAEKRQSQRAASP